MPAYWLGASLRAARSIVRVQYLVRPVWSRLGAGTSPAEPSGPASREAVTAEPDDGLVPNPSTAGAAGMRKGAGVPVGFTGSSAGAVGVLGAAAADGVTGAA